jgi:hypothetical protein
VSGGPSAVRKVSRKSKFSAIAIIAFRLIIKNPSHEKMRSILDTLVGYPNYSFNNETIISNNWHLQILRHQVLSTDEESETFPEIEATLHENPQVAHIAAGPPPYLRPVEG